MTGQGPSRPKRQPPTLTERIESTRRLCLDALNAEPLVSVESCLIRHGITLQRQREIVDACVSKRAAFPELLNIREIVNTDLGLPPEVCGLERTLVLKTVLENIGRIPQLPVDESVGHLFCRDFAGYANSTETDARLFSCTAARFYSRLRMAMLIRFPSGQSDWEISGFPRSWLLKVAPRDLPRVLFFLGAKMKGFHPIFVGHVSSGKQRTFLTERECLLGYYRSALALEKQPSVLGILAASWLHSRETHRVNPHLAFMNRMNEEAGGLYADLGPAPTNEGFLAGDPHRAELYRTGAYKPTFALVMCTRHQALEWMRKNRHLEQYLIPK